ncbi:hypothetical protein GCM10029964_059990 [Kibdelosporangium lantanae]
MARDSRRPRTRRLALVGVMLFLLPSAANPKDRAGCTPNGSLPATLACAPAELVRTVWPLVRFLLADVSPAR